MTLIVFGSVRSPGTTTAALGVAASWPGGPVPLVEADPDGGVLAARFQAAGSPGLLDLAAAARSGPLNLTSCVQLLAGVVPVVCGSPSPERMETLLRAGDVLGRRLAELSETVLVDVGRLTPRSAAAGLIEAADLVVIVTRPTVDELAVLAHRLPAINGQARELTVVLVGARPYGADDVAAHLDVRVAGVLADDPPAATALTRGGSSRALSRSALVRSTKSVAESLAALVDQQRVAVAS